MKKHKWREGTREFEIEVDEAGNATISGETWTWQTIARELCRLASQADRSPSGASASA